LVPGDRSDQRGRQLADCGAHRGLDLLGALAVGQVQQQRHSRRALNERADGAAAALAEDEITFPVAWHGAVVGFCGAFAEHDHAGDAAATVGGSAGLAGRSSGPQAPRQLTAQLASALHEQRLVDRLVAHAHLRVVGVIQP